MDDQEVTEYYHRGVVCHLIGQDLAIPLDVEFQRPGEGEVPAAKRLLERVFANYPRYFDAVVGDGLYFEAPFINFCREQHKHVIVVVKGDHRLLLQDAQGLFAQRAGDGQWTEGRRTVQYWDDEGFTSSEGVSEPLRVLHTEETERRRERIAGQWVNTEQTSSWYWATTFSSRQLPARSFWRAGHWRYRHRERLLQQHLDPLGPGSCFQARTDGDRQFRAHAVSCLCPPAMLLATEPQAALS